MRLRVGMRLTHTLFKKRQRLAGCPPSVSSSVSSSPSSSVSSSSRPLIISSRPLTLPLILLPSQHLYDTTIIWPIVSSLLGVIFVEDFLVYIAMSFSVVCVWAATCSVTVTISLQGSVAAADADVRS